jgi:Active DUF488-N3 subclade
VNLATASFRSFHAGMGQPVSIALVPPKWRDDCKDWPVCFLLCPRWSYFNADEAEFDRQYLAQLDRFGVAKIRAMLQQIAADHHAETLVLICHEADRENCHRKLAAQRLEQHCGIEVPEVAGMPTQPLHEVPAGTLVQVQFTSGGKTYTYDCPDPVQAGDHVWTPRGVRAQVVTVGPDFPGPYATARRAEQTP